VEPPSRPFGWVIYNGVQPRVGPGWGYTAQPYGLRRYQRVDILDRQEVDGEVWYRIGLFEQTLSVYENNRLVYATLISSGTGVFYTRVGVFQIYEKLPLETMRGAFLADRSDFYYLEDVPWTMYYDEARAIHGAYWHDNFGFRESRGCVNLTITDANWVFQWAREGDWVYVWDPSGQTPAE